MKDSKIVPLSDGCSFSTNLSLPSFPPKSSTEFVLGALLSPGLQNLFGTWAYDEALVLFLCRIPHCTGLCILCCSARVPGNEERIYHRLWTWELPAKVFIIWNMINVSEISTREKRVKRQILDLAHKQPRFGRTWTGTKAQTRRFNLRSHSAGSIYRQHYGNKTSLREEC